MAARARWVWVTNLCLCTFALCLHTSSIRSLSFSFPQRLFCWDFAWEVAKNSGERRKVAPSEKFCWHLQRSDYISSSNLSWEYKETMQCTKCHPGLKKMLWSEKLVEQHGKWKLSEQHLESLAIIWFGWIYSLLQATNWKHFIQYPIGKLDEDCVY